MKTRLEYRDDKSHKYWEIEVEGAQHVVTYGRLGTSGQSKTKTFDSAEDAEKDAKKLIASKTKKGYAEKKTKRAKKKTAKKKTAKKSTAKNKSPGKAVSTPPSDPWMTPKAEKRLKALGCWDSVSTRDFNDLVLAGWKYGEKGDNRSALALYHRVVSQPAPAKGAARKHYLLAANNACFVAMQVDDDLAAQIADLVVPVGPDNPSIFHNAACAYARTGQIDKAFAQVELAIEHGYSGVKKMLEDPALDPLESLPAFVELRDAKTVPAALAKHFAPHAVPEELVALYLFDENYSEGYATGFYLTIGSKLYPWSKKKAFKERIVIFAGTGSGTDYALWVQPGKSLSEAPVVVFGGEGGTHVIANDLRDLLRLLTFDSEVSVDFDGAYFYRDQNDDHSEYRKYYLDWLKREFGLSPVRKPDPLTKAAQKKWGSKYRKWVTPFLPE